MASNSAPPASSTTMPAANTTTPTTTSTVVCFKCAGAGHVQVKRKRKRPRPPSSTTDDAALSDSELAPDENLVMQGNRTLQVTQPCHVCQGEGVLVSTKKHKGLATAGVITMPRRPPGFRVRGPLPPAATAVPHPPAGEALCCLTGAWRIFQPLGGHRYSTDDVVTAWVAGQEARRGWGARLFGRREGQEGIGHARREKLLLVVDRRKDEEENDNDVDKPPEEEGGNIRGLDLGCGLGSVLMMVCWQLLRLRSVGIEAQAASVERARRSLIVNGCADRIQVQHADFRTLISSSSSSSSSLSSSSSPSSTGPHSFIPPFLSASSSQPITIEAHKFDLITGTPPYFDGHGAPPPSHPFDPPINVTSLPSSSPSSSSTSSSPSFSVRTKSGKPRLRPSILPTVEDQRPCNFALRGGVEAYTHTASLALAPRGIFVMCASDLPGVEARVLAAVEERGLVVLRKVEVEPKEGQPSLFAVYTMCHAAAAVALVEEEEEGDGDGGVGLDGLLKESSVGREEDEDRADGHGQREKAKEAGDGVGKQGTEDKVGDGEEQEECLTKSATTSRKSNNIPIIMVREMLAVREAMSSSSETRRGAVVHRRTAAYRQVLHDMCMPDNEMERRAILRPLTCLDT